MFLCRVSVGQEAAPTSPIDNLAAQIRQKYAPDARSALFSAQMAGDSALITVESTDLAAIEEFEAQLRQQNILAIVKRELLPSRELGGKTYGVANLSVCNHRTAPANAAEMATQMLLGTPVEILKKTRGYYLVRTPDGYLSWTDDDGVAPMDAASFARWQGAEKVVFVADYGHTFAAPSTDAERVSDLVGGDILQLAASPDARPSGKKGRFTPVIYPDGRRAFVPTAQIAPYAKWVARPNPGAAQIIASAKTLLGVPYLWGGTSGKGVDCSGLTKTAFFLNGLVLPRDASQQALVGREIGISEGGAISQSLLLRNLQAGDLLFFGGSRRPDSAPRVTHTAIYLGNGQFIQAAGQVRINSLLPAAPDYDEVRTRTLLGARRVLDAIGAPQLTRLDQHPFYSGALVAKR